MKNNSGNNGNYEKKPSEGVPKLKEETLKYKLYRVIQN